MRLKELYSITTGIVAKRKEAAPGTSGHKYKFMTLRSIGEDGYLELDELDEFYGSKDIGEKYLTKRGDIIVRLSAPFTAIAIVEGQENIVVPSLFAILRSESDQVLAEYTALYLNSDIIKRQQVKDASGSVLQIIRTSAIKDYDIEIMELDQQRKIVEINKLISKENRLLVDLIESKKKYNKAIINRLLNGGLKDGN